MLGALLILCLRLGLYSQHINLWGVLDRWWSADELRPVSLLQLLLIFFTLFLADLVDAVGVELLLLLLVVEGGHWGDANALLDQVWVHLEDQKVVSGAGDVALGSVLGTFASEDGLFGWVVVV